MEQFIAWYCSEPRLALSRTVILRFRLYLVIWAWQRELSISALRQSGDWRMQIPALSVRSLLRELRGQRAKQLGARTGNWLTQDQARLL